MAEVAIAAIGVATGAAGDIVSGIQGRKNRALTKAGHNLDIDVLKETNKGKITENNLEIEAELNKIEGYERWLDRYGDYYKTEMGAERVKTEDLKASGKETFDNFMNSIGYADAALGASGRSGPSVITGMLDQKLVDYVGTDRKLDEHGGLFGEQLTQRFKETTQRDLDLQDEYAGMAGDLGVSQRTVDMRTEINKGLEDWNENLDKYKTPLSDKEKRDIYDPRDLAVKEPIQEGKFTKNVIDYKNLGRKTGK